MVTMLVDIGSCACFVCTGSSGKRKSGSRARIFCSQQSVGMVPGRDLSRGTVSREWDRQGNITNCVLACAEPSWSTLLADIGRRACSVRKDSSGKRESLEAEPGFSVVSGVSEWCRVWTCHGELREGSGIVREV